jgi:DNA-binding NtrC family response regulator
VARLRRAAEAMSSTGRSTAPSTALSPAMAGAMEAARTAASEDKTIILLLGETGVGKSHLARFIHEHSPRRAGPFLEVGCAGLDPLTAESELFGHERGAFVGAVSQKRGLVEAAEGGTLLLDEVAELPLVVQGKLLTFLDTGDIRRVGGVKRLPADVRIVAATHHDLDRAVADGRFRKDLYFRLRVVPVTLPPLRARRDELPELASAMIGELCRRRGLPPKEISPSARAALVRYEWPGNLRQLKNVLEHALIVGKSSTINVEDLPLEVRGTAPAELPGPSSKLDDIIRRHIESVLVEVGGNRTRAAQVLGIDRATLRRRLGE